MEGTARILVGAQLDPDTLVVMQAQQIIDDVETLGPVRIVGGRDVHELLKPAHHVVAQESHDPDDFVTFDPDDQLVQENLHRANRTGQAGFDVPSELLKRFRIH